jgi:hypothetical protein
MEKKGRIVSRRSREDVLPQTDGSRPCHCERSEAISTIEERARPIGPESRRFAFFPVFFLFFSSAVFSSQDVSFLNLTPVEFYAPYLKISDIRGEGAEGTTQRVHAEMEDFKKRIAKPWKITRELWPEDADCPDGATLTVIHNLVENGGLAFEFTSSSSGEFFLELVCPKGPSLGAIRVSLGETDLGTFDAWSLKDEPSQRHRFSRTTCLSSGTHRMRITQESATDAPIFLRSFRLLALTTDR